MSSSDEEIILKKRSRNQDSDDDWLPTKKKKISSQPQKRKQVQATKKSSHEKLKLNKEVERTEETQIKEEFNSSRTEHGNPNFTQSGLQLGKRKINDEISACDIPVKKEHLTPINAEDSPLQSKSNKNIKHEKKSPRIVKKEKQLQKTVKKRSALNHKLNIQTDTNVESKPVCPQQTVDKTYEPGTLWEESDLLAEMLHIDIHLARNIIRLFDSDNTIPFIARYRRELTGDMGPEALRKAKECYDSIKSLETKAASILKSLNKNGKLNDYLERCVRGARSLVELEHIYAPYKTGSKKTKAEVARQLGLENPAMTLLKGTDYICLETFIAEDNPGLDNIDKVESGISHIIAEVISKDKDVLDTVRRLQAEAHIRIESSKSKVTKDEGNSKKKTNDEAKQDNKNTDDGKYENYYNFSLRICYVKPHQVLAIFRGESQKKLSVKIAIPDWLTSKLHTFCYGHWLNRGYMYPLRKLLFEKSFKDSYTRLMFLVQPLIVRSVRNNLSREAERAAIEVFATNLKKLLLMPPLRGTAILAIDPGFRNGCKVGVISTTGNVLETDILYINYNKNSPVEPSKDPCAGKLKKFLLNHRCEIIGIGNGKACRMVEEYISHLIQAGWFSPLDVRYTIVNEQGASIYSCSPDALKEFPQLDPNLISAISLARRVQDPLSELVKVEPKHLGVGMYQHDVPEKQLSNTLDEVVSECVSFVGVDINTASMSVLRRIAGLNTTRASKILEWRSANGLYTNRQQLRLVKGIGDKTFEQCAGFIRITPQSLKNEKSDHRKQDSAEAGCSEDKWPKKHKTIVETGLNPLDQTWIHPESYSVAQKFMEICGVEVHELGTNPFISKVETTVKTQGVTLLAEKLGISEMTLKLISEGLQRSPDHDFRSEITQPVFRRGVTSLDDLQTGSVVTGRVQNVTHFGTFVDIGVGTNGLIPVSRLKSLSPQLGDRIEVKVLNIELQRKRISLELVKIIS